MQPHKQKLSKLIELYKGINIELLDSLERQGTKKVLLEKTLKELCILAESGNAGAGKLLQKTYSEAHELPIADIESLLEFGKLYKYLTNIEKQIIKRFEIQQEFSHFSRIMNLDGIITNSINNPESVMTDFSRFLKLIDERRMDRKKVKYYSNGRVIQTSTHNVTNSPTCGVMSPTEKENMAALLAVKTSSSKFRPKEWLSTFNKIKNKYELINSICLLDYLIYLSSLNMDLAFIVANNPSENNSNQLELLGTGDCGVIITEPKTKNSYNIKVKNCLSTGDNNDWNFGKLIQTKISNFKIGLNKEDRVYLLHPIAYNIVRNLNTKQLETVLNTPQKNTWINPHNALTKYLELKGVNTRIAILKARLIENKYYKSTYKRRKKDNFMRIKKSLEFRKLVSNKNIVLETAHIHADRRPGKEQEDCIRYTKTIKKYLTNSHSGIKDSSIRNLIMIDDYHVINRLNYRKYIDFVTKEGLVIDEVIMESSPLIRLIAVDILKFLVNKEGQDKTQPYKLIEKGNNLYLEFNYNSTVVELLANVNKEPMIGCVLFDVALCLYKANREYYKKKFNHILGIRNNENIHDIFLSFYKKHKNLEERQKFMESYFCEIPTWNKLQRTKRKIMIFPKSDVSVLNVLANFYKPQQKKVNMFLKVLEQNPILTLFYDTSLNKIELIES